MIFKEIIIWDSDWKCDITFYFKISIYLDRTVYIMLIIIRSSQSNANQKETRVDSTQKEKKMFCHPFWAPVLGPTTNK